MGTHPDGPARVRDSSERLSRVIARSESAQLLNNNNKRQTDEIHLPFIMKIMSIRHTLSLQVHPTKVSNKALLDRMYFGLQRILLLQVDIKHICTK